MITMLGAAFAAAAAVAAAPELEIVRDGRCDWGIVCGTNANDRFAAQELAELFEKATGAKLSVAGASRPAHAFLVGGQFARRPLAEEETSVFADGGDVVLAGGGAFGAAYAVYDFCERAFGYRMYGTYEGAETYRRVRDLSWPGGELSTRPKFTGYRINHARPLPRTDLERKFYRRNRCNFGDRPLTTRPMLAQHGHLLFVPPYDKDYSAFLKVKWRGMFKEHPEYFSLGRDGRRTDKGQLCFSNRDLRKLYIARFREVAGKLGKGVYMVGSNDSHNERYCWCDGCGKLMEKYGTNGGPLFDFIIELCNSVRDMDDVYVATLAYKRPEQTELAPKSVVFPENFVCDAAFLNSDRPVKAMKDIVLPDGRVYNRFENLKEWNRITDHLAWWYYGGAAPIQTYRRMQIEMREILEAGVDSVGACGTGGHFEFGDVGTYMYFQLLRDPDMDADAAVRDVFAHKYGKAADWIFRYLEELERYAIDNWDNPKFGFSCDDFYDRIPLEGADLVRWHGYFDEAERAAAGEDGRIRRNVRIARSGLDCWSVVYASRIRKAVPGFALDVDKVIARGYAACDEAEAAKMVERDRNPARRVLDSMRYYASLKSEALPPELSGYEERDVRLYLPEEPLPFFRKTQPIVKDDAAAAGVAMMCRPKDPKAASFPVVLYDSQTKEWLMRGSIDASALKDGKYVMAKIGTARLPRLACFVLADCWGTSADVRNLGRFYDPTYHEKRYEFWVSVRLDGERLLCDRIYLVDKGMPFAAAEGPKCPLDGEWVLDESVADEFDAPALDLGKWWNFTPWWRGRREYVNRAANVVQTNGVLELWAKRIPESEQEYEDRAQGFWPYTCGIVKSRKKVKYGYFEVRARGTAAEVRNAFWLYDPLSDGIGRPWEKYVRGNHSEEIDIYEFVGRFQDEAAKRPYRICSHVHRFETPYVEGVVNSCKTRLENAGGQYPVGWRPCDGYHVYGLLWTPEDLVWYVDGVETYRRANDHYHTALHVMLDVEIAKWRGADPEKLDASTLPAVHSIDYFRRWTLAKAPERKSFLRKGDLWVMSGDSITHNDFYRQTVAAALDHFHPGHGVRIMNTAVWGQLVADAEGQGLDLNPTVASIMLGMNDVIHCDYPPGFDFSAKAAAYAESIRRQVRDFKRKGADVLLFKPTLTDETESSYFNVSHTREGLVAYGDALEKVAVEEGCVILPIAADFEAFKPCLGARETLIPDGVHPYGWGQYAIARALIHHLRLDAPLAEKGGRRGTCDLRVVGLNDIAFRRDGAFIEDGGRPTVSITAPRDMSAKVKWSVADSEDRGEASVRLEKGKAFAFAPKLAKGSLPADLGTVSRMILSVTPDGGRPQLAVVDFARTKVFHMKDGVVRGEIATDEPRREGPLVGTWEVRVDGGDLWISGRMRAEEWPSRPPPEKDLWMNSGGMNGVMGLFDFRPMDRFAENRFDHDVNMAQLYVLQEPWSVLTLPWINRETANCFLGGAEPAEGGYSWRMGFRGRMNRYTRFDLSKADVFGAYFIFVDCEGGKQRYYPVFGHLFGPERKVRINPEHRLNQTAIFDLKGVIRGDEVVTMGVFGL